MGEAETERESERERERERERENRVCKCGDGGYQIRGVICSHSSKVPKASEVIARRISLLDVT